MQIFDEYSDEESFSPIEIGNFLVGYFHMKILPGIAVLYKHPFVESIAQVQAIFHASIALHHLADGGADSGNQKKLLQT